MQSKLQTADRLLSLFIWLVDFFIYFLIFESQCIYYFFYYHDYYAVRQQKSQNTSENSVNSQHLHLRPNKNA